MTAVATLDRSLPALDASGIERFLFEPINPRSAAIFRVALAIILPYAFRSRGTIVFPPAAWVPHAMWWYHHVFLTRGYAAAIIVACTIFGLGIYPRVMGLILFAMLLPLGSLSRGRQSRQVWLLSLFAFSLVRSDAAWSVRRARRASRSACGFADEAARPEPRPPAHQLNAGPIWPIRLIQIQLCIVYATNAIAKATPHYLSGATLIAMSKMRSNFLIDMSDGYAHLGPIAMPAMIAAVGSVITESYLAVGFWFRKLRWITAAIGVAFHIMLQSVVQIFMLDITSMFLYSAFLLPWSVKSDAAPASSRSIARS